MFSDVFANCPLYSVWEDTHHVSISFGLVNTDVFMSLPSPSPLLSPSPSPPPLQSLRKDLVTHMQQYQINHSHMQADSFSELKQVSSKNTSSLQHLLERVGSLESRTGAVERLQDALEQRVELLDEQRHSSAERYDGKVGSLEEQAVRVNAAMVDLSRRLDQVEVAAAASEGGGGERGVVTRNTTTMSLGYGTGDIGREGGGEGGGFPLGPGVSGRVSILNGSGMTTVMAPHGASLTPVPSGGPPSSSLGAHLITPQRLESMNSRLVEVEHSVDRSLSSCLDQELRIQLLERATYNGVLLWKIDDFERRRKEAIDGITLSLYSTPFYTGRHGYKTCARIYLSGDGLGKGTHMSFFFVVMHGPIDALLPWPFKQKVTLTLLNQTPGKRNVSDSFRPDSHSSSFQRPGRREMNIASGCPMFIRLEHLMNGGFVKDDAIHIRVIVDTSDLPKIFPMM